MHAMPACPSSYGSARALRLTSCGHAMVETRFCLHQHQPWCLQQHQPTCMLLKVAQPSRRTLSNSHFSSFCLGPIMHGQQYRVTVRSEVPCQQHPPGLGTQQRDQPLQGGHSIHLRPLTPKFPSALRLGGSLWDRPCIRELHGCCHGQLEARLAHLHRGMGPRRMLLTVEAEQVI